jgi:hypothetical protein
MKAGRKFGDIAVAGLVGLTLLSLAGASYIYLSIKRMKEVDWSDVWNHR